MIQEKREEKERYDRLSEIITVDSRSTSMGRVSARIEETSRPGFIRWKPISADWYLRQRYHRGTHLVPRGPPPQGCPVVSSHATIAHAREIRFRFGDPGDSYCEIIWIF